MTIATLWIRTEGVDSFPLLCAPKMAACQAGLALHAARIASEEPEWAPCCRTYSDVACVRDQFCDEDVDMAVRVLRLSAERAGIELPTDVAGLPGQERGVV